MVLVLTAFYEKNDQRIALFVSMQKKLINPTEMLYFSIQYASSTFYNTGLLQVFQGFVANELVRLYICVLSATRLMLPLVFIINMISTY